MKANAAVLAFMIFLPNNIPHSNLQKLQSKHSSFANQIMEINPKQARRIRIATRKLLKDPNICSYLEGAKRDFPFIEKIAKEYGIHPDVKYVATIESGHNHNARSHSGAVGSWQFMPETAQDYGLRINALIDERKDLDKSTKAAMRHLKYLLKEFQGDWPLALSAYNAGLGRIKNEQSSQGIQSYWELKLPEETELYFAKVIAIKMIIKNSPQHASVRYCHK